MAIPTTDPAIIRTERGLTISGTRITLYDLMDYLTAQYPPKFICSLLNLTDKQLTVALCYIEANRAEVVAEYHVVLKQAEENRRYWEKQSREYFLRAAARPPKPGREALWAKLREQKAQHELEA